MIVLLGSFSTSCSALRTSSSQTEPKAAGRVIVLRPGSNFDQELHAATEAVNEGRADVMQFAPGEFQIDHSLQLTKRMNEGGVRISGAGPGITKLVFSGEGTGIDVRLDTDIKNTSQEPSFRLEELSLVASGKCGTAVEVMKRDPNTRGGTSPKLFSNLVIEGAKGGSWAAGIRATDTTFCSFRDITLRLPRVDAVGIWITGTTAPVDHHLSGIRVLSADTGIKVGGNVEGVYIDQLTMIGVDVGIDWDTAGHEPLLALSGSHISARVACVRANNILQPVITGNLLYQAGGKQAWTGIDIITERATPYDLLQISNNTLHGNPNHTEPNTGISIMAGSGGVINANVFSAVDTGIRLGKQAAALKPSNNVFKNTPKHLEIEK